MAIPTMFELFFGNSGDCPPLVRDGPVWFGNRMNIESVVDNPEADFGRLFVLHQQHIHGYIRALVPNRHDAEEVLQETASVLWRKFDQFEPGSNFLAWALTVARYRVKEHQRKRPSAIPFDEQFAEAVAEDTVAVSGRLSDMRDALAACLDKLKPRDRTLFQQRHASDAGVAELAREIGRPVSTVYNALARIRSSLLSCIERRLSLERDG